MLKYYNTGLSFIAVDEDYEAQQGEVLSEAPLTDDELELAFPGYSDTKANEKWVTVRAQRDALLAASDWAMLSDAPLTSTEKTAWKAYRNALRDITTQQNPDNVVWPEIPS